VSSTFWGDLFNLQVQYRMQGWSDAWVPLDPKLRSLVFNNLPTGHYTLQFRMSDTGWTPDVGMPSISFLIERHWHEEIWARSMFVLIALLLLLLLFPRFTRRARRRQQALELAVQERTRLLSDANDELRALVEVKDRLVSIISHDIVSPLRFIARVVRHGQNRPRGETEQAAAMADIADATEKLYSNAQNLLSWMKQQGGKIEPRPVHVAMAPFLDDAFRQVHGQARNKGITLINRIGADDVLLVDRDLLSIVVNNLLINALNNMNQGGITVEGINATDHYILRITDDGPGIPEPALARIEQIRAGVREPEAGLLGMGYIIVFDLLRLMGGGIDIRTAASEGTAIALTLPTEVDQS
jgi:signal transduction histidine kinase